MDLPSETAFDAHDSDDPTVQEALSRWLEARDAGEPCDLEALCEGLSLLQWATLRYLISGEMLVRAPLGDGEHEAKGAAGRFAIVRELGEGGMGKVFIARDLGFVDPKLGLDGREVAYKVMKAELVGSPRARERFYRESILTDRIANRGIPHVYARLDDDCGSPAFAMEWIRGWTLLEIVAPTTSEPSRGEKSLITPPTPRELIQRVVDAALIVDHAHQRSIVHADLSLRNVMVEFDGSTRVIDWGIARDLMAKDDKVLRFATRRYQDPRLEQPATLPDTASDIYSLGAILADVADSIFETKAVWGAGRTSKSARRLLDDIAAFARHPDLNRRYSSARDFAADLGNFLIGEKLHRVREPLHERIERWTHIHRWRIASALLILLSAFVVWSVDYRHREQARARAQINQDFLDNQREENLGLLFQRGINHADACSRSKDYKDALATLDDAEPTILLMMHDYPSKLQYRTTYADFLILRAQVLQEVPNRQKSDVDRQVSWVDQAISIAEHLPGPPPPRWNLTAKLSEYYETKFKALWTFGRLAEAIEAIDKALIHDAPVLMRVRQKVIATQLEKEATYYLRCRAASPAKKPDHFDDMALAEAFLNRANCRTENIFNAACVYALASQDEAADSAERDRRAARALALLVRLRSAGYFESAKHQVELQTDSALKALLGRTDFDALVRSVNAQER